MSRTKQSRITLKEAAEISGYTQDYLGQLIRKGKLEGEQVFSNVSWVTTEEALRSYMEGKQGGSVQSRTDWRDRLLEPDFLSGTYLWFSRLLLILLAVFLLFLISIFAISLDESIERANLERITYEP